MRAEIGGFELPISLTAGNAKDTTRAEIEFPEPLQGSEHRLRITAVAPITTAERWRLPMVHVPDAHWQEGDATLRVTAPLALDDLTCKGCRQIKVEPSAQEHAEETIGIQCFGDSPEIDVMVSRQRERIRLASGVSISLRANECAGRFLGDFTAVEGERFSLVAEVAPQWIIDNVESDVAGRIVDWSHEALPGRPGKLKLQLRTPLAPQHPLRLLVTGRRRRAPIAERLRPASLEMLTFGDAEATRQLICLHTIDPYQMQFNGAAGAHYLDPAQLAPSDAALLEESSGGVVFVDDAQARTLSVSLSTRPPRYQAEIHAEAAVRDHRLTESYRFSVVPQGREMARLIVRFSQPRASRFTGRSKVKTMRCPAVDYLSRNKRRWDWRKAKRGKCCCLRREPRLSSCWRFANCRCAAKRPWPWRHWWARRRSGAACWFVPWVRSRPSCAAGVFRRFRWNNPLRVSSRR